MASNLTITHSLAILDDYASISPPHFKPLALRFTPYPSTLNPSLPSDLETLVSDLHPYTIISTMRERTPFPASLLSRLPNLKLLLTTGNRNASFDMQAASDLGIAVTGTTGLSSSFPSSDNPPPPPRGFDSTTQHTFALLLSLCSRIPHDHHALSSNSAAWQSGLSMPIGGRTIGIVGLGKLGTNVARIASLAFGMNVLAWSENLTQERADEAASSAGLAAGTFRAVDKETLFREADVVSLHYVLSPRTVNLVSGVELGLMKSSAVLVNTSRAGLINEEALLEALRGGRIRGAALDVWWQEPLPEDSVWRTYERGQGKGMLVRSPHMGYVNEGTMNSWYEEQAENVRRFLDGEELLNLLNEPKAR